MSTFAEDIEKKAGEAIMQVVVGDMGWRDYGDDKRHEPGLARKGEVLEWDEARPLLDYEYDNGFGAPDCHRVTAWTENYVLFVSQYDGSTEIERVPRNPIAHDPSMPGG